MGEQINRPRHPLVLIEWKDSVQPNGVWVHLDGFEPHSTVKCISVGWLIEDNGDCRVLAPNMGDVDQPENAQMTGIIHIPICAITNQISLREFAPPPAKQETHSDGQ